MLAFFLFLVFALFMNVVAMSQSNAEEELKAAINSNNEKEIAYWRAHYKRVDTIFNIMLIIGIAALAIFVLYILGCIWYFFCGGFLIFEDQPFLDKVICGLISLLPFGMFLGFVAILGGWNPRL